MIRLLLTAFGVICLASVGSAQSVQVRSGQHDGFIRLIVDLPQRVEVKVENGDGEATISFTGQKLSFDTTPVFRRIARDRVRDVTASQDGQSLQVAFGCRCEVVSFWHGESLLVLDIRDSKKPVLAKNKNIEAPEPKTIPEPVPPRLALPQGTGSIAATLAKSQFQSVPPSNSAKTAPEVPQKIENPQTEDDDRIVAEARQRLVEQLSRAASQGLLSPRTSLKNAEARAEQTEDATVEAPAEEQATDSSKSNSAAHINLKAQSSIDRDFLAMMKSRTGASYGVTCLPDALVDVANWGTDAPYAQQVGPLRTQLMGEFDVLNEDAALQLARLYIFFGFGTEARQTLELIEGEQDDLDVLFALSEIVENGGAPPHSRLSAQVDCEGQAALWSILSYRSLPPDVSANKDAVLRAFSALPRHLRAYLGPILSKRLLEADHQDAADVVLRILDRHDDTRSLDAKFVEAEIDLSEGKEDHATEIMQDVAESNSQLSAEALIALVETQLQAGQSVSYDHAVLAGTYAQQYRGARLEKKLIGTYVTALAASGAFDQSYKEYDRLAARLTPEQQDKIKSDLLQNLAANADDMTFVRHALLDYQDRKSEIRADIANNAATRLLEVGFAAQARTFVSREARGQNEHDRKLLRARIALTMDQPRQAETELRDLDGELADLLRAEARSAVGDHHAAAEFYASAEAQDLALREAWLAEDWQKLLQSEDDTMIDAAALAALGTEDREAASDSQTTFGAERILAQNRNRIQQSTAMRETIASILQANPSPETVDP